MITKTLVCQTCQTPHDANALVNACRSCGGRLRYVVEGDCPSLEAVRSERDTMWRYAALLPVRGDDRILSLGEGFSRIVPLPELSDALGGARLFLKIDWTKNPTGTFKDREASLIISRCLA